MANAQLSAIRTMLIEKMSVKSKVTLEQMRADLDEMGAVTQGPSDVTSATVDAGGVPAAWVSADGGDASRVLLYLHGGGFVVGSVKSHRCCKGDLSADDVTHLPRALSTLARWTLDLYAGTP